MIAATFHRYKVSDAGPRPCIGRIYPELRGVMEARISFVSLGVTDLERSIRFYEEGLGLARLTSPPTVAFFEMGRTWLALYPRHLLAADAGIFPEGSGFSGVILSHNVRSADEADR